MTGLPKTKGPEHTLADLVPEYAEMTLDFQPGTRFAYSAYVGLDVVARILEVVSGQTYEEYLRTRLFEPLGMNDTYFFVPPEKEPVRSSSKGSTKNRKAGISPAATRQLLVVSPNSVGQFNAIRGAATRTGAGTLMDACCVLDAASLVRIAAHTVDELAGQAIADARQLLEDRTRGNEQAA